MTHKNNVIKNNVKKKRCHSKPWHNKKAMSSKNQCHKKTILKKNNVINETNLQKKHNVIPPQIRIKWNLNLIIPIGFSTILKSKTIEKPLVFQHFDHAHTRKKKQMHYSQWFCNDFQIKNHWKTNGFSTCWSCAHTKKKHAHTQSAILPGSHEWLRSKWLWLKNLCIS